MLLSISILRKSWSFTVFSVTPLSILLNSSSVNSRPATSVASRSISLVRAGGAASDAFATEGFAPDSSESRPSEIRASVNLPQSTPGKSVEVKPSEEKYARNERRSVVRFMSRETFCTGGREFVYCNRILGGSV